MEKDEKIKKVFESKVFFRVLCVIGIILVALLVFSAGVSVGFRKASFGSAWGAHYNENFGIGHRGGSMMGASRAGMMDYFPNADGATGKIIKIETPNIIVQDKDNTEKVVLIQDNTHILKGRVSILATDLHVDDFVVVIGIPNDKGVIEAKFIRIIPSPEFLTQ